MTEHEAINKRIHQWLGKCWHEWENVPDPNPEYGEWSVTIQCQKCGSDMKGEPTFPNEFPDYCNDGNAMLTLMAAVTERHYSILTDSDEFRHIATIDIERMPLEGYADALPLAVATAVDNLIKSTEAK